MEPWQHIGLHVVDGAAQVGGVVAWGDRPTEGGCAARCFIAMVRREVGLPVPLALMTPR